MKNDAIIKVLSEKLNAKEENLEITYKGSLEKKDDCFEIKYGETELTGMEGTETVINIYENYITLIRTGNTINTMHFEKNKDNQSVYSTLYGDFDIHIKCYDIYKNLDENGGKISIDYLLIIQNSNSEETRLTVDVKII